MVKIYAVTHKAVESFAKERTPIGVGENRNIENVVLYDNTGDNIADKNKHFCELTALYWIWKNTDDEIVGLEHYRRFFCKENLFRYRPLKRREAKKILKSKDVILPQKTSMGTSLYDQYAIKHYSSDMDVCENIIKEKYPDYHDAYQSVMQEHEGCIANIFIMKKELMNEYCNWLFTILFEAEQRINYKERDAYQQRIFGFLSERLFNVWVLQKRLRVKYLPKHDFAEEALWRRLLRRFFQKTRSIFGEK